MAAILIVCAHLALVLVGSRLNFVVVDEVSRIAAGVSHWQLNSFSLCRVNPPLVDMMAALPVVASAPATDYSRLRDRVGYRDDLGVGCDFARANGARYFQLVRSARLPGMCWTIAASWFIYAWSRRLYGEWGGVFSVGIWCLDPNVITWSQFVTSDVATSATICATIYFFVRYLDGPSWPLCLATGVSLGVAQLTKFTALILLALLPALWLVHPPPRRRVAVELLRSFIVPPLIALFVINLGYGFHGSFRPLSQFEFVSTQLSGARGESGDERGGELAGRSGNVFRGTPLAGVRVPVPADYLLGLDVQRRDFDNRLDSYMAGIWKVGGWPHYYLYALAVKEPIGTIILACWAAWLAASDSIRVGLRRAEMVPWLAVVVIAAVVSLHTGFSHHLRYILPVFPFVAVSTGRLLMPRCRGSSSLPIAFAWGLLIWALGSTISVFPHTMSYFNEVAGGPRSGPEHLLNSNIDWGQDLTYLKDWLERHPEARPLGLAYYGFVDPETVGIDYVLPPPSWPEGKEFLADYSELFGPKPGYYAVSVNILGGTKCFAYDGRGSLKPIGRRDFFGYFRSFKPIAMAGYSIYIYHLGDEEVDEYRRKMGLPYLAKTYMSNMIK